MKCTNICLFVLLMIGLQINAQQDSTAYPKTYKGKKLVVVKSKKDQKKERKLNKQLSKEKVAQKNITKREYKKVPQMHEVIQRRYYLSSGYTLNPENLEWRYSKDKEYDKKDRLTLEKRFSTDGDVLMTKKIKYNRHDQPVRIEYYGNDQKLKNQWVVDLNSSKSIRTRYWYAKDSTGSLNKKVWLNKEIILLDSSGRDSIKTIVSKEGGKIYSMYYSYDNEGNLRYKKKVLPGGKLVYTYEYTYDYNAKPITEEKKNSAGKQVFKRYYYYDIDTNNLASSELYEKERTTLFEYQYNQDFLGNWTKKIVTKDGKPLETDVRTISYYGFTPNSFPDSKSSVVVD